MTTIPDGFSCGPQQILTRRTPKSTDTRAPMRLSELSVQGTAVAIHRHDGFQLQEQAMACLRIQPGHFGQHLAALQSHITASPEASGSEERPGSRSSPGYSPSPPAIGGGTEVHRFLRERRSEPFSSRARPTG